MPYALFTQHQEGAIMNMPVDTFPKSRPHPMLITAGIAVVLFCATGTAAILGWIPTSLSSNSSNTSGNGALVQPAAPVVHRQAQAAATPRKARCSTCGTVESTREITIRGQGTGLGAAGGAVVGGLLGNQIGGGHGKEAMTVVGAVGGAVAGNQIEGQMKATHSYETIVRLEDGSTRAVQQASQPAWRTGDHVKIVDGVIRLNG
jgi:outer membrane lipoprotein SlyB